MRGRVSSQAPARATSRAGKSALAVVAILLVLGLGLSLLWFRGTRGGADPNGFSERRAPGSRLPVTISECRRSDDSLRTEGYVLNEGASNVRYVQVEMTWNDASGNPLDSHVTYAIGGEVFGPGDSIGFGGATGEGTAIDCEAALFDYEPL